MRLCYFIPGRLSAGPLGPGEIGRRRAYLERHAFDGTRVEVRESAGGPDSIESAVEESLSVPGLLEAVPGIEAEGFDALIVGCFGDPGLAAARELGAIPVIGPGQAAGHLAARLGQRFGILTVVDEVVPSIRRQMRSAGLEPFLADVRAVDVPVLELRERREEVLATLAAEGERSLAAGADALVLGCMTMGFLDAARELQGILGVPVVNPVLAALKAAETDVALGLSASRRAYPRPRRRPGATGYASAGGGPAADGVPVTTAARRTAPGSPPPAAP